MKIKMTQEEMSFWGITFAISLLLGVYLIINGLWSHLPWGAVGGFVLLVCSSGLVRLLLSSEEKKEGK